MNRQLAEAVSRLQQDLCLRDEQVVQLGQELADAQRRLTLLTSASEELASMEEQRRQLAAERGNLAADRAAFEREFEELSSLRQREARVAEREASVRGREEALLERQAEVKHSLGDQAGPVPSLEKAESAELEKSAADLIKARRDLEDKSAQVVALIGERDQIKAKMRELRVQLRTLRADRKSLVAELAAHSESLQARALELERTQTALKRIRLERDRFRSLAESHPDLHVWGEALLNWVAQSGARKCIGLGRDARLGWTGSGSYNPVAFDRLLGSLRVEQFDIPHHRITHVVVGREGWSKEDLVSQIEMRQGSTLRVYSQEMLLAAFMTARDPLDCADAAVLDDFKRGHPALEFLAGSDLEWPSVSPVDTSQIDEIGQESLGVTESPLHLLGYRVGETSSLSEEDRRRILREAFEMDSLPAVESDKYMAKWGAARSHQRLWRIAFHLSMLLNGPVGRDWRKPQTRSDWVDDLSWLRKTFYKPKRYRFAWPAVSVL